MSETKASLSDLQPDPRNANKGTERGRHLLEKSLADYGAGRSILIDMNGKIIAGNKTAEVAAALGLEDLVIVQTDGTKLVAVQRTDLDINSEAGRMLAYADNRVSEADLDFDIEEILADVQAGLPLDDFWFESELDEMLAVLNAEIPKEEGDAEPQIGRADELQREWQAQTGQLWRLPSRTAGQEHRLICGDARVSTHIKMLTDEGVAIILTDPPYSSGGFQEAQRKSGSIGNRQGLQIASDQLSTRGYLSLMSEVLSLMSADVLYLFTDWRMWSWTYDIAERANYPVRNMLVWDKGRMGMGFPWRSTHELILFGKRTPSKMMDGKVGNVLHFDRASNEEHPTAKPTELIQAILNNSPDGDVYDPFAGSGTTIIAAENLSRQCRAVEISPAYCAVILQRYKDAFGIEPELIG